MVVVGVPLRDAPLALGWHCSLLLGRRVVTPRCRCCHRALGVDAGDWCAACDRGIKDDMRRLQNLTPGEIVLLNDIFATVGAFFMARAMVGSLPFERVDDE